MNNDNSILGEDFSPTTPPTSEEKTLALLAHVITFVSTFIGPLVIYLLKKDESDFVKEHAKESLNFQITMALAALISAILIFILIGFIFLGIISIVTIVLVIVATIKASEGKIYRYPFSIRFIR